MLLNRIEKLVVSNPLRAFIQHHFEAGRLLRMGGPLKGGRVLEVGCGPGYGIEVILDSFGADSVDAFDLDPDMVARTKKRLSRRRERVNIWTADAAAIPAREASYDAAFDFFVIHHVPDWRRAVEEIHRVLKPGGRLYAGEVFEKLITNPIARRLLEHPQHDRFDEEKFREALSSSGFRVIATERLGRWLGWFVAEKKA